MQASNPLKFRKNRKDAPLRPFTLTIYLFFKAMPANLAVKSTTILQIIHIKTTFNASNKIIKHTKIQKSWLMRFKSAINLQFNCTLRISK